MAITRIKNSGLSGVKYKTMLAGLPGVMAAPTATAASGEASVAFTTVSGATSYVVISTPGSITASNTSSPIVVTGLTNDVAYTFQIAAVNANGQGGYSLASNSVTPTQAGLATQISWTSTSYAYGQAYRNGSWYLGGPMYSTVRECGIAKLNATTGVPDWVKGLKSTSGTNDAYCYGIGATSAGNILALGYRSGDSYYHRIIKNSSGTNTTLDGQGFSGSGATATYPATSQSLAMNGDRPYGLFSVSGYTPNRGGIIKYNNAALSENWAYTFGTGEANYSFVPNGIQADSSDNLYISAYALYTDYRVYAFKYSASSTPSLTYGIRFNTDANSRESKNVTYDSSGNLYMTGRSNSGTKAAWLVKLDTGGSVSFARDLVPSSVDNCVGQSIAVDSSGNIYIAGYFNLSGGYEQGFIAKYNSSGTLQWQRYCYTPTANYMNFYSMTIDGNSLVLSGSVGVSGSGAPRVFAFKYPTDGSVTSKVFTIGPVINFTISTGSMTSSTWTPSTQSISSPVLASNTTTLYSVTITDTTPSYTTNTTAY